MKYRIDETKDIPAYLQLYYQLRDDIVHKIYPYGAKMPSKRLLAAECDVSVITSEHAYSILCEEGYIEARERSGYFVIYKETDFWSVGESVSGMEEYYTKHHKATDGEFPFTVLAKTMRKVLLKYGEDILVKSPNRGCEELQMAIGSYLRRSSGIFVKPEQIVIGAGAEYLYNIIIQLIGAETVFAIEEPCYEKIRKVYKSCGVSYEALKLGKDGIITKDLEETNAGVLHVTPFHSYPSNISASASKKNEYIRWAEKKNGIIIEDNYDSELTVSKKSEETLFSMAPEGRVIYLNTFSKTIAPAIRVGYLVLPNNLLEEYEKKLGFYSCTVPIFEQYVITELLNHGDFERQISRVRRNRRKSNTDKQMD